MPDQVNPLASLSAAELASLAKAQAAGVSVVNKDGQTSNISDQTPKAGEAAAAAAAAAKSASGDIDPKNASAAQAAAAAAAKPARPENVPEKFWDADKGVVNTEALIKSYTELEKSRTKPTESTTDKPATMGDPAAEAAAATAAAAAAAGTKTPEQVAQESAAERNGAAQAASADLAREGKITDATYTRLEKAGYTRAVVDEFVAGQKAQAQMAVQGLHTAAGGKESYDKMVAWGTANYTASEQAAFNNAIRSSDVGTREMAVNGLKSRFAAEFGRDATVRVEGNGGTGAGNAFKSQRELTEAMNDKRYKQNDPAFHREVRERISASQRANIDIGIRLHG